jgi:glycyl-tRNA synthetase
MPTDAAFMEKLVALCKRRGFIFQSSEIYGGIGGFWDYGPLGVELKRNIKEAWWHDYVVCPPDGPDGREIQMVGLDCSIIMNPKVWEASGHAAGFADPMVSCKAEGCKGLFRADQVWGLWARAVEEMEDDIEVLRELEDDERLGRRPPDFTSLDVHGITEAARAVLGGRGSIDTGKWSGWTDRKTGKGVVTVHGRVRETLLAISPCPKCHQRSLTEPRRFNLMFESYAGALQDQASKVYLRPETAQGIFVNFKNVLDTSRVKIPFGIAQIGKAFRNEINPRNYTFRSREFEQMEIEFFCRGADAADRSHRLETGATMSDMDWYHFWRNERYQWYIRHGLKSEKLRLRDQGEKELAHYSRACADIEYLFPFSDEFQELEGVAHRGCFDLTQHQQHSGRDLSYFDDELWQRDKQEREQGTGNREQGAAGEQSGGRGASASRRHQEGSAGVSPASCRPLSKEEEKELKSKPPYKFIPTVIEPSAGVDRAALAFLCEAYCEDQAPDEKGVMQTRVVMKLHPRLAPIKAAFFPLVNKEGMPDIAHRLYRGARRHFNVFYDDGGAIGRRYRRQDEAGTPWCITVDGQTLQDGTVTIRDRDTLQQVRVSAEQVVAWLKERLGQP